MRFPRANLQLRRAQVVLMLAVLLPTIAMIAVGVVLLATSAGSVPAVVSGVLVLTFCTSGITGYILGSLFLSKGAALVRVQNDFVASVSHELRTPLTSIHLLIESLRDGRLDAAERSQVLSLLARETGRLEALVGRVLELSRLQSSYDYARDPLDLPAVVEEAIAAFDAITLTRPTPIARRIDPGLLVTGDRPTLVRALVNLLTNAWKYTGDDKRIELTAIENRRWIEIAVRDNGAGIDPAEQSQIFEQFQRGRAADANGATGLGLGLSFVTAIVRGHRGKLDFVSRPGETTFRIRLRRQRDRPAVGSPALVERLAP
ncbi:MAG TPA: ATP-binding protein [Kofleriaceae bacterium]|jgi:two-component system phosphate regulon sensor histidine kinase PhoR|nr:ATP-binding protein [Kofleriaceae bacterium]